MKRIAVPSKDEIFTVLVDDEDYPILARHKWYILFSGQHRRPYAFTKLYDQDSPKGKTFLMHHMIMGSSNEHDHKDDNSLNNQKLNLRPATRQQNGWNRVKQKSMNGKPCSSKYKGVSRYENARGQTLWRVIIKTTKKGVKPAKYIRFYGFKSEREAAIYYDHKIIALRGKWAVTNILENNNSQCLSSKG